MVKSDVAWYLVTDLISCIALWHKIHLCLTRSFLTQNQIAASLKLFESYKDEDDPTAMNMEGISKLCEEIDIDPLEDIRVLVLLWKLNATEKPGHITKDEVRVKFIL